MNTLNIPPLFELSRRLQLHRPFDKRERDRGEKLSQILIVVVLVSSSISRSSAFAPPIKVIKTSDLLLLVLDLGYDSKLLQKIFRIYDLIEFWSWLRLAQQLMFDLIFVEILVVFAMDPDSFASSVYRNLNFEMFVEVWLQNLLIYWRMKKLSDHLESESVTFCHPMTMTLLIHWIESIVNEKPALINQVFASFSIKIQIFMFWLQLVDHGRGWWHSTYCLWQWYWNG